MWIAFPGKILFVFLFWFKGMLLLLNQVPSFVFTPVVILKHQNYCDSALLGFDLIIFPLKIGMFLMILRGLGPQF